MSAFPATTGNLSSTVSSTVTNSTITSSTVTTSSTVNSSAAPSSKKRRKRRKPWLLQHDALLNAIVSDLFKCSVDNNAAGLRRILQQVAADAKHIAPLVKLEDGETAKFAKCAKEEELVASLCGTLTSAKSEQDMDGLGKGATPLHVAASKGHLEICKLLLRQGKSDPEARTTRGITAKAAAAKAGFLEIVNLLKKKKASSSVPSSSSLCYVQEESLPNFNQRTEDLVTCHNDIAKRRRLIKAMAEDLKD